MPTTPSQAYPLGNTQAEHERLARQAARFAYVTERAFRRAGVGPGQRVLELGSGAGDVAMLVAELVGPSGEVLGIERDSDSIAWARARAQSAGLTNVRFTQSDVADLPAGNPFDVALGRFILMFVPDPVTVMRSVARQVRPGGIIVFLEVTWSATLHVAGHLPLWNAALTTIHQAIQHAGARPEQGPDLYRVFRSAGLPAPTMHLETMLGASRDLTAWPSDLLKSMRPQIAKAGISLDGLGDLDTLAERLHAEVEASGAVVPEIGMVSAWCTTTDRENTPQ